MTPPAPPPTRPGVLTFSRTGGRVAGRRLAGSLGEEWTAGPDAGGPWAAVRQRLDQLGHPLARHWLFGGAEAPEGEIALSGDTAGMGAGLRVSLFNRGDDEVLVTLAPCTPPSGQGIGALSAIEQSGEGLALTDAAGRFTYMNPAHLALFGFQRPDEVIGRCWEILYDATEAARIRAQALPALRTQGIWHGLARALRQDGTSFTEDLTLSILPDGGIACNCRDRTEEFRLKDQIERSAALFHNFVENVPAGVFIKRPGGEQHYVNRQAAAFFGKTPEQLVGRLDAELFPADAVRESRRRDELVVRTRQTQRYEIEVTGAAGAARTFEATKFALLTASQEVEFICAIYSDVTARRQLEREAARVAERQGELIALQHEFVSMVSHEFRTPLAAIQSSNYLLRKNLAATPDEKVKRYLELQQESVNRLRDLVDQVLCLNRVHQPFESEVVAGGEITDLVLAAAGRLVKSGADRLPKISPAPGFDERCQVMLETGLFRVAIENLLSNALKFSPPGTEITLELATAEGWLSVAVRDHGIGIPAAEQAKLFTPFFRASNARATPGAGLGLVIVRRTMDFHGGQVDFTSTPTDGTLFRLSFPLTNPAPS